MPKRETPEARKARYLRDKDKEKARAKKRYAEKVAKRPVSLDMHNSNGHFKKGNTFGSLTAKKPWDKIGNRLGINMYTVAYNDNNHVDAPLFDGSGAVPVADWLRDWNDSDTWDIPTPNMWSNV